MSDHARLMDADGYWRQFEAPFYFNSPGDRVEGHVIQLVTVRRGDPPAIKVQTQTGRVYIVTARQARLLAELVKAAPAVQDWIVITYNGEADKAAPGMNKAKEFSVDVRRAKPQTAPVEKVPGNGGIAK